MHFYEGKSYTIQMCAKNVSKYTKKGNEKEIENLVSKKCYEIATR